ncbi:MAG: prepilin-type N-terminal cleavage/methylation domain-containing protein [Planctomycetota bacterium]
MVSRDIQHSAFNIPHSRLRRGFSLVELLTVIFIIGLLIAILVPSLSAARNAAKKMTTAKEIDSIKVGLEMFKNENGPDFPQTNGYPPSFAHPPIGNPPVFQSHLGQFPFLESKPVVTGAHWLPATLMGVDKLGYLKRSSVPNKTNLRAEPWKWYTPDPLGEGKPLLPRGGPYADPGGLPTRKTKDLPGRPNRAMFPSWTTDDNDPKAMQQLPVVVDAFDQPILYYAANAHGRETNMVEDARKVDNNYTGGPQKEGPPFYFHQDNTGFTGIGTTDAQRGWDFGNSGAKHTIALSGADHTAAELRDVDAPDKRETFARYIVDRKLYRDFEHLQSPPPPTTPLRPVNAESYLLISAGVDGRYGTQDDVSNLPPWTE